MSAAGAACPLLVAGLLLAAGVLRPGRSPVGAPPATGRARRTRPRWARRRGHGGPAPVPELAAARSAEQVAALLRAGVAPATAWAVVDEGVRAGGGTGGGTGGGAGGGDPVRVVRVVRRLVTTTGAPAAGALEACAAGLRAQAEAAAAVRTALAGARVSARTVSALPLLGLVLGAVLGARPWEVLLTSGAGRGCALAGVVLLVLGHRWSARLVHRAERVGR
ncbi:type II secretion protein F [Kineococcus sp. LSe6-4]|uniref:Type II secretion protein F n=1 Tax=Kineococcus halophytocola TaxID=3234027 RepID=A0ABV4H1R3_9ACTN